MTSVKKMLAVATAFAMVSTPVIAAAAPAAKLSVVEASKARAGTKAKKSSQLGGSVALAVLAAAAVVGGIALAASGGGSSANSP